MSTTEVGMSADSETITAQAVQQRLDDLESRVESLEEENQALREELEAEREMRKALVDTLGEVEPENVAFGDVTLGGAPIEGMFKSRKQDFKALTNYLFGEDGPSTDVEIDEYVESHGSLSEQLEQGDMHVTHGGLTESVRQRLLPIHEMWIDVREGREEKVPSANERRGARLFSRFVRKASGEHDTGVNADYGTYSMDSSSAREILQAAGDMTKSGKSMTVKRAMKAVQSLSKQSSCDCDSLEDCEHGVLVWENDGGHKLTAHKDAFNAHMNEVESAIEGDIDSSPETTDDEGNASEDAVEDDNSEFAELDNATAVTNDEDDSVQGEVANTAVSHHDGAVLDAADPTTHDT